MKLLILLAVFCVALSFGQATRGKFSATYEITSPSIGGKLTGTMYYSETDKAILMKQDDGYSELFVYSSDTNKRFAYYACTGGCESEAIDASTPFPIYYKLATDSCASTKTNGCFKCTRNDESNVDSICVDDSDNLVSVTVSGNTITLTSDPSGVDSSTFAPPSDCSINCYAELDIVLVIDESGSISGNYNPNLNPPVDEGEWSQQRNFAIQFVSGFEISPNRVHMGLVQFSKGSRKIIEYPHIVSDSNQFTKVIDGLTKKLCTNDPREWKTQTSCHGATWTGHGLIDAISILKDESGTRALRKNAGKIIVIVTDGNSYVDYPFNYAGRTFTKQQDWVDYVVNSGITVISVGVGNGIGEDELSSYSSTDPRTGKKLVFKASDFNYLESTELIEALGSVVCKANGVPATCGGNCMGSCQCGECKCPTSCDLGNMCQTGTCSATVNTKGGCFYKDITCSDGNACTVDTCNPATGCNFDEPVVCDDQDLCTIDSCKPATGCAHTKVDCSTGNFCDISTCQSINGECSAITRNPICDDDNACTEAVDTGVGVVFEPINCTGNDPCKVYDCNPNSTAANGCFSEDKDCDDGNACSIDMCSVGGECMYESMNCTDYNLCTDDLCDIDSGCYNEEFNATTRCDDGNICTVDLCDPEVGCIHEAVVCESSSNDPCIEAICDPIVGCIEQPVSCPISENADPDCTLALCVNGTCQESQTEVCINSELLATAVATGTVILVVAIIAGAVCLAGTTAGAVAAWGAINPGDFQNQSEIYKPETQVGTNPIHEA